MTGASMGEAETGKDSRDASEGGQWKEAHGFHFLENGIGPVGAAPVIAVEPHHSDDFLDFDHAEGSDSRRYFFAPDAVRDSWAALLDRYV